ncbi:hypothetical protein [Amycolatopsis nigrescens]|uniref:hypothetical protein n=1 Tax=Amycolatopsis nigrescens TaxID=381445 RepID=UPI0003755C96|nr:hypothetical protein [Amycolatopsis nigrescens]
MPVIVLAACTVAEPEPPSPAVTTHEFEQRLDEYLNRFASHVLAPDAQISVPAHTRTAGCADGPSWGVVPRSETTVTAGDQAEKLFEDLQPWLQRNEFDGLYDGETRWQTGQSGEFRELAGTNADGTKVLVRLTRNNPQFAITVTGPCTWPPDRDGGPPTSGRLAPLPAPSAPVSTIASGSYVPPETCRSPNLHVFNSDAPAFTGPGPHPMVLADYAGIKDAEPPTFLYGKFRLPYDWEPEDEHQAQLVVCVRATITRDTGRKVTRNYTFDIVRGGSGLPYEFDVFDSVYLVTVREARTGRVVGESSIPGTVSDENSTPSDMQDYLRPVAVGLDNKSLERFLRPFHESAS